LRFFAREHGLRRIVAFGSATRDDFRPDSDLDLVVEAQEDQKIGLRNRINMIVEAERLFGRDVDIVMTPITRPALAERIERDGVVLYDSANRE
jgi:predicted nucleotidyltransferase